MSFLKQFFGSSKPMPSEITAGEIDELKAKLGIE